MSKTKSKKWKHRNCMLTTKFEKIEGMATSYLWCELHKEKIITRPL